MRKLISAVFLALMALIQVHAQDSDLRSAPDLPTFKVTLNYSASEGGTITSDISSGAKVAYDHGECRVCACGYNHEYGHYRHVTDWHI